MEALKTLPDESVHCICTSPPYWGLRDYGTAKWEGGDAGCDHVAPPTGGRTGSTLKGSNQRGTWSADGQYRQACAKCGATRIDAQIGLESTPQEYVEKMVAVFREVRRVLKDDGVLFLNLGDSYARAAESNVPQTKKGGTPFYPEHCKIGSSDGAVGSGNRPGSRANSSTLFSQKYKTREDLTSEEFTHVAMEMFGVRINGNEAQREGQVSRLLSPRLYQAQDESGPAVSSERIEGVLSAQQSESVVEAAGEIQAFEMGGNQEAGREVCLLRGKETGIYDGGSRQRGRGSAQEKPSAEGRQVFINQDLQGHPKSGIPEVEISSALLQLQLRDRLLGILSSHAFEEHEIPDTARFAFTRVGGLKPKDLIGIPWRVAFALQADGWYLRSEIIWHKLNPMPESVRDRPTKAHEQIFLLSKNEQYFYDADAIAEKSVYPRDNRAERTDTRKQVDPMCMDNGSRARTGNPTGDTRNKRSVWMVATQPFKEAHFAAFPPALIEPCILAGCPPGGVVLDCFGGAGTTGLVADRLRRNAILIELNPEYAAIAEKRIRADAPLFTEIV